MEQRHVIPPCDGGGRRGRGSLLIHMMKMGSSKLAWRGEGGSFSHIGIK